MGDEEELLQYIGPCILRPDLNTQRSVKNTLRVYFIKVVKTEIKPTEPHPDTQTHIFRTHAGKHRLLSLGCKGYSPHPLSSELSLQSSMELHTCILLRHSYPLSQRISSSSQVTNGVIGNSKSQ